jgi:hypothetical protein
VTRFKNWIATRIAWIDENLPGDQSLCALNTSAQDVFSTQILPNPAKTFLTVIVPHNTLKKITLLDISGKIILEVDATASEFTLSVENINNGIYFCKIENNQNTIVVKKVIIAH